MILVGAVACDQAAQKTAEVAEDAVEEVADATEGKAPGDMSFTPEELEKFQNKFTYDAATGYYKHNRWGGRTPNRRTLTVDVYNNGGFILSSVYYGESKLNHNRVIVTAGEERIPTYRVKLNDEAEHVVQADGDKRYEINSYSNYSDENVYKIFTTLGKGVNGDVKLRFDHPDRASADIPMNGEDLAAIQDCYKLSLLLRSGAITPPAGE